MRKTRNSDTYYDETDDDNMVIPDGYGVRVRMALMDGQMKPVATVIDMRHHQPHFAELSDQQHLRRDLARQVMIDRQTNAWRTMGRDAVEPDDPNEDLNGDPGDDDDIDDQARRERTRSIYLKNLQNAWRTPPRMVTGWGPSAVGPDNRWVGTGPTTDSSSKRRHLTRDEADARRNAAYEERNAGLVNAWKQR